MVVYTSFDSFLLFGDSLTQFSFDVDHRGWGAQLANAFQRRLDVINRGFSGYTTTQALHLLPQLLPPSNSATDSTQPQSPKIQFLTLFLGANDAALAPSTQHTPIAQYAHNLRLLLDMVHSPTSPTYSPKTRVIVICPPPVEESLWAVECEKRGLAMNRDWKVTREYAEVCLKVAQEYSEEAKAKGGHEGECQVDVIDTWGIMMAQIKAGKRTLLDFLRDGVHLASEGNNVVFKEIMEIIKKKYPEWNPAKMEMHGPWWRDLDLEHPETDLLICANKPRQLD